jgi:Uma2 family endonuclease
MVTIELPAQAEQRDFNEQRWAEVVVDPVLAEFQGRIETDRHGKIVMSPPPAARHGRYQSRILLLLERLMPEGAGEVMVVCPISTADGVRAPDAVWYSKAVLGELGNRVCFPKAPEICVEVRSPDNSERAMFEKATLYFDAGAKEVWLCDKFGRMTFFDSPKGKPMPFSKVCPLFSTEIKLD